MVVRWVGLRTETGNPFPLALKDTMADCEGNYPTLESGERKSFRHQVHNKYVKKIYG